MCWFILSKSWIAWNRAGGGNGQGGNGQGGGSFNGGAAPIGPSRLTLRRSRIVLNQADGGTGIASGNGQGGGLYLTPGGIACADPRTAVRATTLQPTMTTRSARSAAAEPRC